jgi:uncharacterized protein (DUF433 family)
MKLPEFHTEDGPDEIRLAGHRIGLYTVVRHYKEGRAAERIAEEFPTLSLALIFRVLAFYLENQAEVDEYVRRYSAVLERQEQEHVPGPGYTRLRRFLDEKPALESGGEAQTS